MITCTSEILALRQGSKNGNLAWQCLRRTSRKVSSSFEPCLKETKLKSNHIYIVRVLEDGYESR